MNTSSLTFTTEERYESQILPVRSWVNPLTNRWNGYVFIPKGHVCFGLSYDEMEDEYDIQVHGGLTYSSSSERGDRWVFGFDTGHLNDGDFGEKDYRDRDYVKKECENLSRQLAAIKNKK